MENERSQINNLILSKKRSTLFIIVLLIVVILLFCLSLFVGQYGMTFIDTIKSLIGIKQGVDAENIINILLNIRLPRTLSAIIIGGILSVAGITYQSVFRNTLVSQDILGISTSSCVGAALGIVLGLNALNTQMVAFALGMFNLVMIFVLSSKIKLDKTLSLILSGILIGGMMSSILTLIKYLANPEVHLQAIIFWTMGDISSITYEQLSFVCLPVTIALFVIFLKRWELNYFCLDDNEAKTLGVNIHRNRIIFLICATTLVASAVSISGSIGWIGLVIPQIVRLLIGSDNKMNIPVSFLLGSIFLLVVDLTNRIISSAELPVSILTGILGLPLFVICWFINARYNEEHHV